MYNTYILRVCPLKKVFGSPRYPLENLPAMGYVLQKICAWNVRRRTPETEVHLCGRARWRGGEKYDQDPQNYTLVMTNIAIENGPLCWIFPLKMEIFHSYVSLLEGIGF